MGCEGRDCVLDGSIKFWGLLLGVYAVEEVGGRQVFFDLSVWEWGGREIEAP